MHTLNVKTSYSLKPIISDRVAQLMRLFGLRMNRLKERRLRHECQLSLCNGQICFITGSSGSGKSVMLNALYEQVHPRNRIRLDQIPLEQDTALIDCLDPDVPGVWSVMQKLSKAGLSDVFSMLNTPAALSTGQKWRYQLARAITSDSQWIFADEFTASLDRITACVIAHNLRKFARRTDKIFVLASCHEDILMDLQPDVIVINYLNETKRIIYKEPSQSNNR